MSTRHVTRDGDTVVGQLADERVDHFPGLPGRLACDRYAAARRSTSFHLQRPDPALRVAQLGQLIVGRTGLHAVLDVGFAHPLRQRHRMHPEIGGKLLQRRPGRAITGDPDDVLTELTRIGLGHSDILPTCPSGKPSRMSPIRAAGPNDALLAVMAVEHYIEALEMSRAVAAAAKFAQPNLPTPPSLEQSWVDSVRVNPLDHSVRMPTKFSYAPSSPRTMSGTSYGPTPVSSTDARAALAPYRSAPGCTILIGPELPEYPPFPAHR